MNHCLPCPTIPSQGSIHSTGPQIFLYHMLPVSFCLPLPHLPWIALTCIEPTRAEIFNWWDMSYIQPMKQKAGLYSSVTCIRFIAYMLLFSWMNYSWNKMVARAHVFNHILHAINIVAHEMQSQTFTKYKRNNRICVMDWIRQTHSKGASNH